MVQHKVFVHLGAHRTGSSSFQMFLGHNRPILEDAGFNLIYPNRDGAVGGYSGRIELPSQAVPVENHRPYFRNFVKPMRAQFTPIFQAERPKTILSEENILGRMGLFFRGRFYPQSGLRLDLLSRGLVHPIENALIVIRDYGDLYRSASAMLSQFRHRPAFADSVKHLMAMQEGWPDLIERLLRREQVNRLTIVPYEFRGDDSNLLKLLCGNLPTGLFATPHRPNISASAQALAELQKYYAAGGPTSRQKREKVIAQYPTDQGNDRYDPLTKTQKAKLTKQYRLDLDILAKRSDITFVSA